MSRQTGHFAITVLAPALLLLGVLFSCSGTGPYRRCEGAVWATTYHITYRSAQLLDDSILSVMQQVEASLSPFASTSLVSRINSNATNVTDSLFRRIFRTSVMVNFASNGAFDPTVAPLVNLWGFGYKSSGREPSTEAIDSALMYVGIKRCQLQDDKIVKASPLTEFDFSAITKGYGCDLIGEMFQRNGCNDYLIEIGGEVAARGLNPQGQPWRIMIDAPVENDTTVSHNRMAVIDVTDCGVATSGNYRNFRVTSAGKAWHTISPSTGRPAVTSTVSATVIAPTAMLADALATACMAMPIDSALFMIQRMKYVEALLVTRQGENGFSLHPTTGFPLP
ncbi:MAG: FAD:protein FMN transferase [Firmicutes bacterium]|nr:FAD:protein FMN transferase [Bacillota bacterium]MCM1402025.1 FAD:protein FMN transferase [Bacteroides sp.]MCM1477954.1 FAD:protein FMN transferase [Bacteroides sp.]